MKRLIMLLTILLPMIGGNAAGQHYTDWTGFDFLPGRYDDNDHIVFYELQKDYTIDLTEYFEEAEKLPDCCEDEVGYYWNWAYSVLTRCNWDFIKLELGGKLTIKKGYRWDGASYLCKTWEGDLYCPDEYHNFRSSLVHDALYDLMRMGYHQYDNHHEAILPTGDCVDTHLLWGDGDDNRRFADMMHYMIAMEDGDPKDDAQSDYFWLRVWGACATFDDDKLCNWKYHVSDLTAYATDGKVELEWVHPNVAGKDPDFDGHFLPITGYSIRRNGVEIATVDAYEWIYNPPLPPIPSWVTSYTDNSVVNGTAYGYQIFPLAENANQDDWSNEDIVIPMNGPGNALRLDGIDDYAEANTVSNDLAGDYGNPLLMSWTQEAWVYPEEENNQGVIMAFNTIDGGNINLLTYDGSSQKFCYYDGTNGYLCSTEDFAAGNWYHLALTVTDRDNGILYVNGTTQVTFGDPAVPSYGAQFSIGQEWDEHATSQHFRGKIDEVRIWRNVARTQADIKAAMYLPLLGNETGLIALWHFDEPHETNYFRETHDATSNANDGTLLGYANEDLPFTPSDAMKQLTDITEQNADGDEQIPNRFALNQNYPNPFNASTSIEFALPRVEFVQLDIFNILGKKVETLISCQLPAGKHSVVWNTTEISSGIYFYRIDAGQFSETRKMTLLK